MLVSVRASLVLCYSEIDRPTSTTSSVIDVSRSKQNSMLNKAEL